MHKRVRRGATDFKDFLELDGLLHRGPLLGGPTRTVTISKRTPGGSASEIGKLPVGRRGRPPDLPHRRHVTPECALLHPSYGLIPEVEPNRVDRCDAAAVRSRGERSVPRGRSARLDAAEGPRRCAGRARASPWGSLSRRCGGRETAREFTAGRTGPATGSSSRSGRPARPQEPARGVVMSALDVVVPEGPIRSSRSVPDTRGKHPWCVEVVALWCMLIVRN
jgi:hypothetical protein